MLNWGLNYQQLEFPIRLLIFNIWAPHLQKKVAPRPEWAGPLGESAYMSLLRCLPKTITALLVGNTPI